MLIDADIVAVSPASVWRVLGQARRMQKVAPPGSTKKGTGFVQPVAVHEHWHIDIAHINIHAASKNGPGFGATARASQWKVKGHEDRSFIHRFEDLFDGLRVQGLT